jgi:LysR family transcriptional regulator for metE and metH
LHLPQSAVSHQLRGLEQRLGVTLFERVGRRLLITPRGERLVGLAHEILAPLARAELELKRESPVRRQRLRVATQCYSAYHWLPQAVALLSERHPEVDLSIAPEAVGDVRAELAQHKLELALCVTAPKARGLARRELFRDELVLAVPRGHRLERKRFVLGAELAGETLVITEVSSDERARVLKALFLKGERFARVVRVPITEAVVELVCAGLGVSIVPLFSIHQRVARGDLAYVRLTARGLRRTWTGVYSERSPVSAAIVSLLDSVRRQAPLSRNLAGPGLRAQLWGGALVGMPADFQPRMPSRMTLTSL